MNSICAVSCQAKPNVYSPPIERSATPQKRLADDAHRKVRLLIARAEACLASAQNEKIRNTAVDARKPGSSNFTKFNGETTARRICSQSALLSVRSELAEGAAGVGSLLSDMEIVRFQVTQLYLRVQQSRIKSNSASQHELSLQNIAKMQDAIDQAARSKAADENRSFWGKLSNILGMAVAVMGVLLAPFTGGVSLLATAYLVVDLGLQLGEQISGIRMSVDSGLQIAFKAYIEAFAQGSMSDAQSEFAAGIASAVTSLIIAVGMTILTAGGGAPKLFAAFSKFSGKMAAAMPKVSVAIQGATHLSGSATGIVSGTYGLDNASSEYRLSGIEVQRENIGKERQLLLAEFEQCNEDMKKMLEGLRRDLSQMGDALSKYYDSNAHIINSFSRPVRYAA